jgi:transcriptional regulator with XRE-family HTH domain
MSNFSIMQPNSPLVRALGENVRSLRIQRDLTQQALGDRAHLHRTYLADVERGGRNVSIESLAKIAKALGVTISDLCAGIERERDRRVKTGAVAAMMGREAIAIRAYVPGR